MNVRHSRSSCGCLNSSAASGALRASMTQAAFQASFVVAMPLTLTQIPPNAFFTCSATLSCASASCFLSRGRMTTDTTRRSVILLPHGAGVLLLLGDELVERVLDD